ncbi:hypothetical protein CPC08DRAFT_767810 [Agrocybe pediades]|nr:hypothetical protein CPC08DRAFT_767810 [Agrocybe pediades]
MANTGPLFSSGASSLAVVDLVELAHSAFLTKLWTVVHFCTITTEDKDVISTNARHATSTFIIILRIRTAGLSMLYETDSQTGLFS